MIHNTKLLIDILKKRIEGKIGKPVKTRGDCELVSNAILETLDIDISYSTIKRLYGLAPYTKPNSKTTNIFITALWLPKSWTILPAEALTLQGMSNWIRLGPNVSC